MSKVVQCDICKAVVTDALQPVPYKWGVMTYSTYDFRGESANEHTIHFCPECVNAIVTGEIQRVEKSDG